jgi:hypothetical protein
MDIANITLPTEFLWFLAGAVTYKTASSMLGHAKVINFAQDSLNQTLKLLVFIMEDVAFMRQMKYMHMQRTGVPEEVIEATKEVDEQTLNIWKTMVIYKFRTIYPDKLKGVIKFSTWQEAANILDKEIKKKSSQK